MSKETDSENSKKNHGMTGRKVAGTAAALTAAAGMLVNGVVMSPSDIIRGDAPQQAVVIQADLGTADGGLEEADEADEDSEKSKKRIADRIRAFILNLPLWVRVFFMVPLWAVGCVLNAALGALWTHILSPASATIIKWLIFAAIVAVIILLVLRTALPDMPVRKILCRKNFLIVIIGTAVLAVFMAVAPLFIEGFEKFSNLTWIAGGLILIAIPVVLGLIEDRGAYVVPA